MLDLGQGPQSRFGRAVGGRCQRGIFRINPAQKRAVFLRIWRDQGDSGRWGQQGDVRRINNLKYIKAKRMQHGRRRNKTDDGKTARSRRAPIKEERCGPF